jgi:hypothetical protein
MRLIHKHLKREIILKESGFFNKLHGSIPSLNKDKYRIIKDTSVGGDAPKELLRVYEYEQGKKQILYPQKWPIYIAKTGHKWYPFESITEYILNRLGECMGLKMAESRLYFINGQIRFLSKLFRTDKNQILEHGAELYSGYIGDKAFVDEIEQKNMARDFLTISFTQETIKHFYPHQYEDIFDGFIKMLVYDAFIGNNDRHYYNWAILKHLDDKHQPYFSPIYDTARALFWNRPEEYIRKVYNNRNQREDLILKYVKQSKPKIGLEKTINTSHVDIIKVLCTKKFGHTKDIVLEHINKQNFENCVDLLNGELKTLWLYSN